MEIRYIKETVFVNVYEVDRCYGGPEEGGWYFDAGTAIESRQVPGEYAKAVSEEMTRLYPRTGRASSVNYRGGDYRVRIEAGPGADYPETTPHYE